MRPPRTVWSLETLGRVRLSRHFYMREFLFSEIGAIHGIPNIPDDPDRAIAAGRQFCEALLDPLEDTFGRVALRSGYRSRALNDYGNANGLNCAKTDNPMECHVWDRAGPMVAGATVVIPWFADQFDQGRDWRDLAWWVHDHLPYSELWFFPKLCAFNLVWRDDPWRTISSYVAPRGMLLRRGAAPDEDAATRARRYADFPPFGGAVVPAAIAPL